MLPGLLGLLSAVLPIFTAPATKLIEAGADKILGIKPGDPQNVDERIKLMGAETDKLKTVYSLDQGGETYKWVEAIRKLQRPIVVFAILGAFIATNVIAAGTPATATMVAGLAEVVIGYLFGERGAMYLRGKK